jgi:hypothetical protein
MKRTEDLSQKDINGILAHIESATSDFEKKEKVREASARKYWSAERKRLAKMDAVQFNAELKYVDAKRDESEKLVGEKGVILGGLPVPIVAGAKPTANQINELFAYKYTIEKGLEYARKYRNSIERLYAEPAIAISGRVKE